MTPIDIHPTDLETVRRILREHVPTLEVRAFGSRVAWKARETSDLDLALMTDEPLGIDRTARLRAAFTDSPLPFRVDIVDWASTSESFQRVIEREHVVLVGKRGECSSSYLEWPTATIEDISEKVAMGPFGSSIKVSTFVPDGVPIISGQHLHGVRVDDSPGFNFISYEHAQRLANANVRRGDVIFTHAGNIGQVAYIPARSKFDRYVISQRQFYMRCKRSKAIPEFIALYFTSPEGQHQLLANSSQVGVPAIARPVTYLRTIEIPLPPLPEQRAIAHILGTLDDKIELNRRMNETLEAMARALFKSWFVDFDPVRAKAALRPAKRTSSPPKVSDGTDKADWPAERARAYLDRMDPEIAALFPDRFVDSGLGEIPEGWEVRALVDCFSLTMGQSPPGHTYNDDGDGLPFFQGRADFDFRYPETRKFCNAPTRIAWPGDTLISVRAPVGDINMAWEQCCIGRGVAALRHKSVSSSFTYYSAWSIQGNISIYEHSGTVFGAINKKQFESLQFLNPRLELIEAFDAYVSPMDSCIEKNTAESRTLAALRDALLPKLVSGEVRMGNSSHQ